MATMIDPATYLAFVLACCAVVAVPGPTVTVIVANSLRFGARAGLANVAGTQAGLALMLLVLAAGLQAVVAAMGTLFEIVKLIGAAYLIYLGLRMWLNRSALALDDPRASVRRRSFFWQGLLVVLANPKALLFFGAFIPQFLDPAGDVVLQTILLGATFMVVATLLDGAYAVLAGRAGAWLTRGRVRILELVGGTALIGGGLWLAFSKRGA